MTKLRNNNPKEVNYQIDAPKKLSHLTKEKLEAFCGTIRNDGEYKDRIYRSNQSVSNQIADDYSRRFLIELIQNGYDAHPNDETKGRIKIFVAPQEEEWGVVYVANTGSPFILSNVEALCDIGLSDKPIGQTIGNKGLGFRSVNYISDDPQIFSQDINGDSKRFYGFCFRFAKNEDIDRLIKHPLKKERAKQDLPPFHIPVAITEQSDLITDLSLNGFSTVIRLPLRNKSSLDVVFEEIEELRNSPAPVLLFLNRLTNLEVLVEGNPDKSFTLTRSQQQILVGNEANSDQFYKVDLAESGKYFVVTYKVPEIKVKEAIQDSINKNQLHAGWESWKGDGDLALAIRIDKNPSNSMLYTFLPMTVEASAPFNGYLNAAFYAKLDRRRIESSISLNRLYFSQAFELCARTILSIHRSLDLYNSVFSENEIRNLIIDLLAWDNSLNNDFGDSAKRIDEAFRNLSVDLLHFPLLPIVGNINNGWSTPSKAFCWNYSSLTCFTAERLTTFAEADIIDPTLGDTRIKRLAEFLERLGKNLNPTSRVLADLVEKFAQSLIKTHASLEHWQQFYSELGRLFPSNHEVLIGRQILLCSDLTLRATPEILESSLENEDLEIKTTKKSSRRQSHIIFLPPRQTLTVNTEAIASLTKVPKLLSSGIAFLDDSLEWHTDKMQSARAFLERAKLARNYDAEEVISYISQKMRDGSKKIRQQGLLWVFNLYNSWKKSSRPLSLTRARLFVPTTTDEWIPARDAIFSFGWAPHTLGSLTSNFLKHTTSTSKELRKLSFRLLASPKTTPFKGYDTENWVGFLSLIGVKSGLSPVSLPNNKQVKLHRTEFSAQQLGTKFNFSEANITFWDNEIRKDGKMPYHRSNNHTIEGGIWYFPGQDEHEQWNEQVRISYAELILYWLKKADRSYFKVSFFDSNFPQAGRFEWSTPLAAFLRRSNWFPVKMPRQVEENVFFQPLEKIWLQNDEENERPPVYLPSPHNQIRKLMRQIPELTTKLSSLCKARIWNANETLIEQVNYLAELYQTIGVEPYHLKSFLNSYSKTWEKITSINRQDNLNLIRSLRFIVTEQNGKYQTINIENRRTNQSEIPLRIYVKDTDDDLSVNIVKVLGELVFSLDFVKPDRIASLLKPILGSKYSSISGLEIEILVNDQDFDSFKANGIKFAEICPILPKVILLATECLTGLEAQKLPADRTELVRSLNKLRLMLASSIILKVLEKEVELPENQHGTISIPDEVYPTIALLSSSSEPTWDDLARTVKPLSVFLKQPALAYPLDSAFRALQRNNISIGTNNIDANLLAVELKIDKQRVTHILNSLRGNLLTIHSFLRPLICYYKDETSVKSFSRETSSIETTGELIPFISKYIDNTDLTAEELLKTCENSDDFFDLRDQLSLDFAKFNKALLIIGEEPDLNPEIHNFALSNFIDSNRIEIMDCLREPFLSSFEAIDDLRDYIRLKKELDLLKPKKDWLISFKTPPDDLLNSFINDWLIKNNAPVLDTSIIVLKPVDEISRLNKNILDKFITQFAPIIRAWCEKNLVSLPDVWRETSIAKSKIVTLLNDLGVLDFHILSYSAIFEWLVKIEVFPSEMPHSNAIEDLNLSPEDLKKADENLKQQQEEAERKRRSVDLGIISIDSNNFDSDAVSNLIKESVKSIQAASKLGEHINLSSINQGAKSKPGGGGSSSGWREKISPQKKELIGFIGECVVYHWLKKKFRSKDIDHAWVSNNREKVLPGTGNDSLGCDFVINYRNKKWHLEVKSSMGDPLEFELGETEVSKARDCAGAKSEEYYIIYVSNLSNLREANIEQLPNPMSDSNKNIYKLMGEGLKYKFLRS